MHLEDVIKKQLLENQGIIYLKWSNNTKNDINFLMILMAKYNINFVIYINYSIEIISTFMRFSTHIDNYDKHDINIQKFNLRQSCIIKNCTHHLFGKL